MLIHHIKYIMKKVGIITLCGYDNYGNRLQNYATQEVIKSLGCEVETIVNSPYIKLGITDYINKARRLSITELNKKIYNVICYFIKKIIKRKKGVLVNKRRDAFKKFTKKYINETDYIITPDCIPDDLKDKYDYFIVGSDQVWNPNFISGSFIDFLTFAPKEKRIAYSASFGITNLPEKYISNYSLWLSEMPHISVREESGAKIVKDLTGKDAIVLIDPTMMLTKEQWLSISKPALHKPDKPYILTYFLGEITPEIKDKIYSLSKNYDVVKLADIEDKNRYVADPAEFLDYINSSSLVLTDSFHGTIFSILFEKPFIVFNRIGNTSSMISRIDTLLSKFHLDSRRWDNIRNADDFFKIDFSHVHEILEYERNKAIKYLKNALDIKEENKL